ncbi:hypothetical protein DSECCO2_592970 [anaerobic digester metagenome]
MKDGMNVFFLFADHIKDSAGGGDDAAGEQQPKTVPGDGFNRRLDGDHDQPAHGQIAKHGEFGVFF